MLTFFIIVMILIPIIALLFLKVVSLKTFNEMTLNRVFILVISFCKFLPFAFPTTAYQIWQLSLNALIAAIFF